MAEKSFAEEVVEAVFGPGEPILKLHRIRALLDKHGLELKQDFVAMPEVNNATNRARIRAEKILKEKLEAAAKAKAAAEARKKLDAPVSGDVKKVVKELKGRLKADKKSD